MPISDWVDPALLTAELDQVRTEFTAADDQVRTDLAGAGGSGVPQLCIATVDPGQNVNTTGVLTLTESASEDGQFTIAAAAVTVNYTGYARISLGLTLSGPAKATPTVAVHRNGSPVPGGTAARAESGATTYTVTAVTTGDVLTLVTTSSGAGSVTVEAGSVVTVEKV